MECRQIIMNYTVPPSREDMEVLALGILECLPDELERYCNEISVVVEDMVDDTLSADLDIDDPFELLAIYKNGKEITPGVERKVANDDDVLVLYRRAILDMWCETEDDLLATVRNIIIEELGRYFEFSDDEIQDMTDRHFQGAL